MPSNRSKNCRSPTDGSFLQPLPFGGGLKEGYAVGWGWDDFGEQRWVGFSEQRSQAGQFSLVSVGQIWLAPKKA